MNIYRQLQNCLASSLEDLKAQRLRAENIFNDLTRYLEGHQGLPKECVFFAMFPDGREPQKWILQVGHWRACVLLALVLLPASLQAERPAGTPADAVEYGGHWYVAFSDTSHPEEAATKCLEAGGYLTMINSAEEQRFVKELLIGDPSTRYWVGGIRSDEGWIWADATPMREGQIAFVSRSASRLYAAMRTAENQRDLAGLEPADSTYPVGGYVCEWGNSQTFEVDPSDSPNSEALTLQAGERTVGSVLGEREGGEPIFTTIKAVATPGSAGGGFRLVTKGKPPRAAVKNALNEVKNLLLLRHGSGFSGLITLSAITDGEEARFDPGTSLAWAVLADALITGEEIDSDAVLFGDVNADGKTRPAGSMVLRFRGLENVGFGKRVGIPSADAIKITDLLVAGETATVSQNAIYGLEDFEAALSFVSVDDRTTSVGRAVFADIEKLSREKPANFSKLLKHPAVREKLRLVNKAEPNQLSALSLLAAGEGKLPATMSLNGSWFFIYDRGSVILEAIEGEKPLNRMLPKEDLTKALLGIQQSRNRLDPKSHRFADAIIKLGDQLIEWHDDRPTSSVGRNRFIDALNATINTIDREKALAEADRFEAE